ncbi:unnamed protein product [Adineta ricciae]|uniref:Uncharacterized protein n=1 Tax=Adineta ricciae TaxID=249248 RepID=A0A815E5A0_ADIRI|nr:unnamed protein product [Adineta ricciae]
MDQSRRTEMALSQSFLQKIGSDASSSDYTTYLPHEPLYYENHSYQHSLHNDAENNNGMFWSYSAKFKRTLNRVTIQFRTINTQKFCSQQVHICVRHSRCSSSPVCYPLSMIREAICPLSLNKVNGYGKELNQLWVPNRISIDKNQNVYIADSYNDRIMKWKPTQMH